MCRTFDLKLLKYMTSTKTKYIKFMDLTFKITLTVIKLYQVVPSSERTHYSTEN